MKINLRKSAAIQSNIQNLTGYLRIPTSVTITKFDKIEEVMGEAEASLTKEFVEKEKLFAALFFLRTATQKKSNEAGIPDILAQIQYNKNLSELYKTLSTTTMEKEDVVKAKYEDICAAPKSQYERKAESFSTSIVNVERKKRADQKLRSLAKETRKLQDRLLDLNTKNEFELDESTESILKELDLE